MKNPFAEFKDLDSRLRESPLEGRLRRRAEVQARIRAGFLELAAEEIRHTAWEIDHGRIAAAYNRAAASLEQLAFEADDIEELLTETARLENLAFGLPGPFEIFLAALVNRCPAPRLKLDPAAAGRPLHFLGYRLPRGRTLVIAGDAGEYAGAGLAGGRLVVEGSVGNWCGAGMLEGEIVVAGDAGKHTANTCRAGPSGSAAGSRKAAGTVAAARSTRAGSCPDPVDPALGFAYGLHGRNTPKPLAASAAPPSFPGTAPAPFRGGRRSGRPGPAGPSDRPVR